MVITKQNKTNLAQISLHDCKIVDVLYRPLEQTCCISYLESNSQIKRAIQCYDVLHIISSAFNPWGGVPVWVNHCEIYQDVVYHIEKWNVPNREYLTISPDQIQNSAYGTLNLTDYFVFSILFSSGDKLEIITNKVELH